MKMLGLGFHHYPNIYYRTLILGNIMLKASPPAVPWPMKPGYVILVLLLLTLIFRKTPLYNGNMLLYNI